MNNINQLTTTELKNLLRQRGLPHYYRKKKDLVNRLRTALRMQSVSDVTENSSEATITADKSLSEVDREDLTNQIQVSCAKMSNNNNNNFSFRDIEESLVTFDGETGKNVTSWLKEFTQIATMCKWNDIQKYLYARRLLRGAARLAVESNEDCTSWDLLQNILKSEFTVVKSILDIHRILENRKKRVNESFLEYVYTVKQIASDAKFDEETIVAYIIQGIPDDPVNKIMLYEAKTIENLKLKLKAYETMRGQQVNKTNSSSKTNQKPNLSKPSETDKRCFTCGAFSHNTGNCPHKNKGTRCFRCSEFGHIATNCSKQKYQKDNRKNSEVNTLSLPHSTTKVMIKEKEFLALIDTGSDATLVTKSVYNRLNLDPFVEGPGITLMGFGNEHRRSLCTFPLEVKIGHEMFYVRSHVVPDSWLNWDVLIGKDLLKDSTLTINPEGVTIVKKLLKEENSEDFINKIDVMALVEKAESPELQHISDKRLKSEVEKLIRNYSPRKPTKSCIEMKIMLEDETPIFQKPRRFPPPEKEIIRNQINEWLRDGIIQPSRSAFASPVVLVKKADGSPRLCIDFRKLNQKVVKDRYPLPIIEEVLEGLYKSKVFTTLDLKNGFFHVDISENSRKYTAFVTSEGQYEFLKVPFGLCNSPAVFQRYVNVVLQQLIIDKTLFVYMDDVIIPSRDESENLEKLRKVLMVCAENGLILKWSKCKVMNRKINFLGHVVEDGTVKPSEEKVDAVMNFPIPKTVRDVRSFLGLTGFFRKFIANYSLIARPLTELTKKEKAFYFGDAELESFNQFKKCLCEDPVLKLFNPDLETELHTDASQLGFGAILLQKHEDAKFHPSLFLSFKTNKLEEKYSSYELECLAIVKSLSRLRPYLLGLHFKIFTDCKAFQQTMKKKELSARIARWVLILEEYDYTIHHRSGTTMKHVDALSRHPVMLIIEDGLLHHIRQNQLEDEYCQLLFEMLKSQPRYKDFVNKNNLIYRFEEGNFLLFVPKKMQRDIIKKTHERGHISARKVQSIIQKDFYFPQLSKKIEQTIRNCVPCILASRKEGKPECILNPIEKLDIPLDTYHIDHLGPLASTAKSYKHLLVLVDAFTKFCWIYPVKDTSTDEVIKKLNLQSEVFGNPVRIISDRGTAFTSNNFETYCKDQHIQHNVITTGVPRGNGQVERLNRVIISALTKMSIEGPTKWYRHVPSLQRFLNSTVNRATKRTPFELLFGVKMKIPEDMELAKLIEELVTEEFEKNRNEMRQESKLAIEKIQEENKRYSLRKRKKAHQYKVNDMAAIKKTQFSPSSKLFPKYLGPYKVIKVKGKDRYDLQKLSKGEGPVWTSSSADNMKPWEDPEENDSSGTDEL